MVFGEVFECVSVFCGSSGIGFGHFLPVDFDLSDLKALFRDQ